jgi:hypothetical protein
VQNAWYKTGAQSKTGIATKIQVNVFLRKIKVVLGFPDAELRWPLVPVSYVSNQQVAIEDGLF